MSVMSRGTLSSIAGKTKDYPEDREWERRVIEASMTLSDSAYYDPEDLDTSLNVWGIYERESCPHLTIGFIKEGIFRRK